MKKAYISQEAHEDILEYLKESGYEIHFVVPEGELSDAASGKTQLTERKVRAAKAVASHADIYCCKLGAAPDSPVFLGDPKKIGAEYPKDIVYNAAIVGNCFIHNLDYTDGKLLDAFKEQNIGKDIKLINVKQGYTKCNLVVVDDAHAITSDMGIAQALNDENIEVLVINQGFVSLQGFDYGFLGGASGRIDDEIVFNGDLSAHPDFDEIVEFIEKTGLKVRFFKNYPLTDIGSIIAVKGDMA